MKNFFEELHQVMGKVGEISYELGRHKAVIRIAEKIKARTESLKNNNFDEGKNYKAIDELVDLNIEILEEL